MDDLSKLIAILLTLAALLPHVTGEIHRQEVDSATAALRSSGYNLFGNSLTVSDLLFEVLSGKEFTFLSPPDTSLFSLGMKIDAFRYVHSLRLHVIPRRLSVTDLRNLSISRTPFVETLVPTHSLFLADRRREFTSGDPAGPGSGAASYVVVNGVRISSPDIYLGPHIAVHGLEGTLAADMLPPESFQGLGFATPPAWPPSEHLAPLPPTGRDPDSKGTPIVPHPDLTPPTPRVPSPESETFANPPPWPPSEHLVPFPSTGRDPDSKGSPIVPHPDLPPPTPRVSSPESETFANSPKSPHLASGSLPVNPPPSIRPSPKIHEASSPGNDPSNSRGTGQVGSFANSPKSPHFASGSFAPVNPPPSIRPSPKIPEASSPGNDLSNSRGTGQVGSSFRPINPSPESSPSVKTLPPSPAPPFSPPRIWGTPPTHPEAWKNDPNHPWEKPKKRHESAKHRHSKKKHNCRKHRHSHRKHKGL